MFIIDFFHFKYTCTCDHSNCGSCTVCDLTFVNLKMIEIKLQVFWNCQKLSFYL